ncbi:MAG: PIN domain-containing protein [Euryarchaeota archaeon]
MVKYIDTNIFIHAIIRKKDELSENEKRIKENSMKILKKIQNGIQVRITTFQIAEIMNILEKWEGHDIARDVIKFIIETPNVKIHEITQNELFGAIELAEQYKNNKIGFNDLVTVAAMRNTKNTEIYSFDKHFDQFQDINRLEE